jgi:hypothetical protein
MKAHFELSPRSSQPAFPGKVDRPAKSFCCGAADVDATRLTSGGARQPNGVNRLGIRPHSVAASGSIRTVLNGKSRMNESNLTKPTASDFASEVDARLVHAYLETEYGVEGAINSALTAPAQAVLGHSAVRFTLKVGEPSADLLALHRELGVDCSAFITPCNPLSRSLSDEENTRRMGEFIDELRQRSLRYVHGLGAHPECEEPGGWKPEPSVLVLGLSREAARRLGLAWEQNAIVWSGADSVPQLVMLR